MKLFYVLACPSHFELELISVISARFYDIILCFGLSLTLALFKLELISARFMKLFYVLACPSHFEIELISARFDDILFCLALSLQHFWIELIYARFYDILLCFWPVPHSFEIELISVIYTIFYDYYFIGFGLSLTLATL